jgi:ABC-type multidrug transport system permease subunit
MLAFPRQPIAVAHVVSTVLVFGILSNGLFTGGARVVHEREAHILRRFKVAPVGAVPLLVSSMLTGVVMYTPSTLLTLVIARVGYGAPFPDDMVSFLVLIVLGTIAFRAVGLILGSVANSPQEANILVQLVYLPLLFLSGAMIPLAQLPASAQVAAQFLPASYLMVALQGILLRGEGLIQNWQAVVALVVSTIVATFISIQVFRWQPKEKIRGAAKIAVVAVLCPFVVLGMLDFHTRDHLRKGEELWQQAKPIFGRMPLTAGSPGASPCPPAPVIRTGG